MQLILKVQMNTIAALVTQETRTARPPFVSNDYFCDSGVSSRSARGYHLFSDNPLWDGQGCIHDNPCCQFNNPPWFNKTLPTPTTDDIEMRLCMHNSAYSANIALEQMELYVY